MSIFVNISYQHYIDLYTLNITTKQVKTFSLFNTSVILLKTRRMVTISGQKHTLQLTIVQYSFEMNEEVWQGLYLFLIF